MVGASFSKVYPAHSSYSLHTAQQSLHDRFIKEAHALWRYRACIPTLVANNLRRRYQRSVFGFLWSLLNPLLSMAIMTYVFSMFFHKLPNEFALYVFSGLLPWIFISTTITNGCGAIVEAEAYLKKLNLPKMLFPAVLVSTEAANFCFSLLALVALAFLLGLKINAAVIALPLALIPLIAFTFGIVLLLCVGTVYFRDIAHIVGVAFGGLFYLTPVVYPLEVLPEGVRKWFLLNPINYFLNLFRALISDGQLPSWSDFSVSCVIAIIALVLGISTYLWRERDLIYRL